MKDCSANRRDQAVPRYFLTQRKLAVNLRNVEEVDEWNRVVDVLGGIVSHLVVLSHRCVNFSYEE